MESKKEFWISVIFSYLKSPHFFLLATQLKNCIWECSIFGTIRNSSVVSKQPAGMLGEDSHSSGSSGKKKISACYWAPSAFHLNLLSYFQDWLFFFPPENLYTIEMRAFSTVSVYLIVFFKCLSISSWLIYFNVTVFIRGLSSFRIIMRPCLFSFYVVVATSCLLSCLV